jgi:hypothetical protein
VAKIRIVPDVGCCLSGRDWVVPEEPPRQQTPGATVNTYADQLFVQAEINRRLELFGVADALHPSPPTGHRRATLARLADRARQALRPRRTNLASTGSPCHP